MVGADRSVLVRLRADISDFQRKFAAAGSEAGAFTRRLEEADGRMANLVQTGLALAPALVPIGALAVPALAGLTQQLGLAAAAAGVTFLAFQGVGDALKALNDYQVDPTEAHFKKLQQTMDAIGPSGQIFVRTLQDLRPEMQKLQDVAEQGMFPGLTEGIHELIQLQPEVEHIIGTIATGLGEIAADAADGLNDQRWVDFIGWLDSEATPTLKAMASALGYTFEGLASMMQEFDPLADGFTNGMVDYARSFRSWADGLDQTDGFKEFVDYIQTNGPEAMSTLGALARALIDLVSAAAPVGAAALPVIEALAHGLSALAESNVGPTLITAAAAIGVLGRSLAILRAVGLRGDGDSILGRALNVDSMKTAVPAMREAAAATADLQAAESAATAAHTRYIGSLKASSIAGALVPGRVASENMVKVTDELVAANQRQATAAERARVAEEKRAAAVSKSLSGIGRAAGVVGGLAFATSGLSDDMGLANTATYAMLGTIAGPWGSAIGGAIGLTQDLAGANNDLAQAVRVAHRAMADGSDIAAMQESLAGLDEQIASFQAKLTVQKSWNPFDLSMENVSAVTSGLNELFTHTREEAQKTRDDLEETTKDALVAVNGLGQALGQFDGGTFTDDVAQLAPVLQRVQPALEHMGLTVADLGDAVADGSFPELSRQIVGYLHYADSAEGRTRALADSMSEANDEMVSTSDAAADLSASLDALLGPGLNLSQATDQWAEGLDHLKENLDKTGRSLVGQSDASRQNREAIRGQVTNLADLLKAQAETGAGAGKLARQMRTGKQAILEAGDAAGLSKEQIRAYFKQLGLGPKVIKTLIDLNVDPAVRKHRQMMADLKELDRYKAVPHVDADTAAADQKLQRIQTELGRIVSKSITVTIHQAGNALGGMKFADGGSPARALPGLVRGPGGPRDDRVPAMLSAREYVMPADSVDHYGVGFMDQVRARRLAGGGFPTGPDNRGVGNASFGASWHGMVLDQRDYARALEVSSKGLKVELTFRQKLLEHEVERDKKATDLAKQHYDAVRQDIASLTESIATRFKSDLFAEQQQSDFSLENMPQTFASAADAQAWFAAQQKVQDAQNHGMSQSPTDILEHDLEQIEEARKLFRKLEKSGLHGGALEYAQSNASNEQLAALLADPKMLKKYQRLYGQREQGANQLGQMAAMQRYGDKLDDAVKELSGARKELRESKEQLREANHRLHHLEVLAEKNPKETGDHVGGHVNGAATAGAKGRVLL